ncbi:MAG: matrixin family metalloprotease [Myxococcaceae bacterium]
MSEKPLFWNKDTIGVSVESEELRAPLMAAIADWNAVPCGQIRLVLDPHNNSSNKVVLRQKHEWSFEPNVLAMTILSHCGNPAILSKVQIQVNQGNRPWTYLDYKNILLHELGHFLGLGHSDKLDAVMHPMGQLGDSERELTHDDITKFCALSPTQPEIKTGCSQAGFSTDAGLFGVLLVGLFIFCTARKHSSIWRWT